MSRLTGNEAKSLMEAYNAVYASKEEEVVVQESTEELSEQGQGGTRGAAAAAARRQQQQAAQAAATNKKIQAGEKLSVNTAGPVLGALGARTTVQRNQQGNLNVLGGRGGLDKTIRLGGSSYDRLTQGGKVTYVKRQPEAQQNLKGLSIGPGGFNINNKPVQTTPTRPATPAPVKPAPAPATTTAKTAPAPGGVTKPEVPSAAPATTPAAAPARRSIAQDLEDLRAMRAASVMRQQGQKINGKYPLGSDVQAASKSVSDLNKGTRQYMQQDVDLFDIVKGHLMSEGYADTEEAALVIMANMSEEWRQSIIEGGINFSVPSRIDDFNNRRDELKNRYKQDVGPRIPGPGGGGQYGEPSAPKATGVRLARGTSSSNRGTETKNNA